MTRLVKRSRGALISLKVARLMAKLFAVLIVRSAAFCYLVAAGLLQISNI